MKVTVRKQRNDHSTLKCKDIEDIVSSIRQAEYACEVTNLRTLYPLLISDKKAYPHSTNTLIGVKDIPSIGFSAEYRNSNGKTEIQYLNPLFVIEINHLVGYQEAEYLRDLAAQLPYTFISFMGASGRSVKIICKARCSQNADELDCDGMLRLIRTAYADAAKYYTAQLETAVDIKTPALDSGCKLSADPDVYYNPGAEEFFVADVNRREVTLPKRQLTKDDPRLMPGYNLRQTQRLQFENYLSQAIEANLDKPKEDAAEDTLHLLARYCHDDGLPKEMCICRTLRYTDLGSDELFVRTVFDNAYKRDIKKFNPLSHFTPEVLLTLKTQMFMEGRYELRKNILKGVVEYRHRDGRELPFRDLSEEVMRSMTQDALLSGLKSWDKDMQRYIRSSKIQKYDPINDYLDHLSAWDGVDRIEAFAARVPNDNPDWQRNFHVWMLSMVAHWMGKDALHGNAYTPLLIGPQGCGKSSFCRKILPPQLDSYYYDHIDFKNEQSADLTLTRFALINIDEFDQLSERRQAILKYLLQKSEVKTRKPYGVAIEELRRFASFVGTTNSISPLSDPSGSRRFICVLITGNIDFQSPVDHDQLYAQAVSEINANARYWFNDEETAIIMSQNDDFRAEDGLSVMVTTFFRPTQSEQQGEWISNTDILAKLREMFKNLKDDTTTIQKLGRKLKDMKFKSRRTTNGRMLYLVLRQ
jgi:hypothetical protein